MALNLFIPSIVSRGEGQSVIARAAYNAREVLRDERTGELKDYSRAQGLEWSGIFAPKDAPEWAKDRAQLWNAVELREDQSKRHDSAQLAREFIVTLPHELNAQQRLWMVTDFGRELMRQGMVADLAIHAPHEGADERNYHAHILTTMRHLTPEGFGDKNRDWNKKEQYQKWNERWSELGARQLQRAGFPVEAERFRIGHLSRTHQREAALQRGDHAHAAKLENEANIHLGPHVAALEKRGVETERGNAYREIAEINEERAKAQDIERQIEQRREFLAEQEQRERGTLAGAAGQKPPAPNLARTPGEIRLAYSLTQTGKEFAEALEDRGFVLARVTEADAERLNRWERQRLKELAALAPEPLPGKDAQPEAQQQREESPQQKPQRVDRADTWMAQTGGAAKLTPELLEQAQASYDQWRGPKQKYGFANYVDFVQKREAERKQNGQQQEQEPPKEYEKYRVGELVAVSQYGHAFQLTYSNTGDSAKARADHLKDIDLAPLLSVTAAENVAKKFQQHRQEERRQEWQQRREDAQKVKNELHWPTNAPQPERQSAGIFAEAAADATRDYRPENLRGVAGQVWEAYRQSGNEAYFEPTADKNKVHSVRTGDREAFAAALDDKGISFAVASKDEADRSHKQAALARAAGNYAPRFKEGEIVIVTEPRPEYRRDGETANEPRRVYKLDQTLAEKFVKTLDNRSLLKSIEATVKASDERAQQRAADREASRLDYASDLKNRTQITAANLKAGVHKGARVAGKVLGGIGKGIHGFANAAESLLSPKLTPEQKLEAKLSALDREAEADSAEWKRQHDRGDRERDQ